MRIGDILAIGIDEIAVDQVDVAIIGVNAVKIVVSAILPGKDPVVRDAGEIGVIGIDEMVVGIGDLVAVNHTAFAVLVGRRAAAVVHIYAIISAIDRVADNADVVTDASVTASIDAILLRGDGRVEHDPAVPHLHVRHGAAHDQTVAALCGIQGEVGETDITDPLQLNGGTLGYDDDILRLAGGRGEGKSVLGTQPLDVAAERNMRISTRQQLQGYRSVHAAMVQFADSPSEAIDKLFGYQAPVVGKWIDDIRRNNGHEVSEE